MRRRVLWIASSCTAVVLAGAAWGLVRNLRVHNLMHDALAGRDEPIRAAIAGDPGNADLWGLLGEAYAAQQRYQDAILAYDHSITLDPTDEDPVWMKGIAEVCRGNAAGINAVEAQLMTLNPESAAQFRQIAPHGCCAFGRGCSE